MMKRLLRLLKKCRKGFTLMECVCAIAVVGLISALVLPLMLSAMQSLNASDSLRKTAANASNKNATVLTSSKNNNQKTLYVNVSYTLDSGSMQAESAFVFTESVAEDSAYEVRVTYYDLKYGKETEDAK